MIHSYSSLSTYRLCPYLHKRQYIDKAYPFVETAATKRGNKLHKKMEDYFEKGGGLPYEFKGNKEFVALLRRFGARAEMKIGMMRQGGNCDFFDKKVWLRGKIDVYKAISERHAAIMVDWKSGNPNYTDEFQATVYAAFLASTSIERVLFVWGYFSGEHPAKLVEPNKCKKEVVKLIETVEADAEHAPTPCWKCRWCPATECEYNRSEE